VTATVERTSLISEPGVYPGIPDADYHRDCVAGGSLSSTGARTLVTRTPAHFAYQRKHGRPDTAAFDLGHAAHNELLGRGMPVVEIDADSWRTKAAKEAASDARADGKTPLLTEQYQQVRAMVAAIRADPVAGKLFARPGRSELTVVARDPESGVMCRARLDWLPDVADGRPIVAYDLKTTDDASPAGMAKTMARFGYHQQGPFYTDCLTQALSLVVPVSFLLVGVEKEPPHLVGFGEPDEQAIAWGRRLNRKARDIYRRCTESGIWPGHDPRPVPLSLPGYQLHAYEAADDAGLYDTEKDAS
jgi:hypothetical protein